MATTFIYDDSPLARMRRRHGGMTETESATSDRVTTNRDAGQSAEKGSGQRSRSTGPRPLSRRELAMLETILAKDMDYMPSEKFLEPDAEFEIYENAAEIQKPDVSWYRPLMDDLTPAAHRQRQSRQNTGSVLLTAAEERVIFLQYNYARFRVREIQKEVGPAGPTDEQARELIRWYSISRQYRKQIAETNLALVLAMAKRTRMSEVDFADLVSEGNMALLRSVDKFDCGRGFKFSTYACRAILKAFSRQGMKLSKYRQRFPTDFDPAMERSNHLETLREERERETADEVRHIVMNNDADLSSVERTVIHYRFGIGEETPPAPLTLEQVGQIIGVTKERVRQIQNKALVKLRHRLEAEADADAEAQAAESSLTDD